MAWWYEKDTPRARRTTSPGGACVSETQALVYAGRSAASHSSASARGASRRRRPSSTKRTRVASSSARPTRCSERTTVAPRRSTASRKSAGALGIELRGRLVEQQQLRLECERRREADTLELTAGELDRLPPPEMEGVHRDERPLDAGPDLGGRYAQILESERHLVGSDRHHDLVLRILEDGRHRAGELRRASAASVEPGDDDAAREAAPVEVRHEPRERAQQRRLAGARRAEERNDLPGLELERDAVERRRRGRVGEGEVADGR